jgi:hypothetical protein
MELREVEDGVSMHDESNSAHQFSMVNASAGDSERCKEIAMQTSVIDVLSNQE